MRGTDADNLVSTATLCATSNGGTARRLAAAARAHLQRGMWLLFPGICVLCDRRSDRALDLCRHCEADFVRNDVACPRCALPMADGALCGPCIADVPPYGRSIAPFRYAAPLTHLIPGLKRGNGLSEARILATLAAPFIASAYAGQALPEVLVPVPLAFRRRVARGFNQAALLARCLSGELGVPVDFRGLRRTRHGPPQQTLTAAERKRLSATAFHTVRTFRGERVAIVDDVMTTGATVRAAAKVLRDAGAIEVDVWVTARAAAATLSVP